MATHTTKSHTTPPAPADRKATVEGILAKAQSGRAVIQDFVPLADSLEWNLGQQRLRVVDALNPGKHLPHDIAFANGGGRPFRAVYLNYVIDCLPVGVLDVSGEQVKQLCVRTCVARTVNLEEHTDMTAAMLAERAK